jgi:hypothetical protein
MDPRRLYNDPRTRAELEQADRFSNLKFLRLVGRYAAPSSVPPS